MVPDLPTPLSEMLELHPTRSDRCRHPDPPALRRLRAAPVLARLPHLQRTRPPETRAMRTVSDQQAPRRDHGPGHGRAPGLLALRHDIATAEHSITANRWLTKQPVVSVLADLAAGRMPLTHEALDKLPKRQILEHLRLTLVAVGALPERDEELIRLERALTDFLATQQDPARRKVLHRYLIWNLLRRLRSRNNGRPTTRQQALRIRLHRRAAEAFLGWLDTHNLTLATFGQADLEHWLTDPAGGYRYEAATFIRWAHANKLTTAYLPARRWRGPVNPIDDDHRWGTARKLLHDSTIDTEDRLAGLLAPLRPRPVHHQPAHHRPDHHPRH